MARKMLRSCAYDLNTKRTWTHGEVRKHIGVHTPESMIESNQIRWLKYIIKKYVDDVMFRGVFTGTMKDDLDNSTNITPWMENMCNVSTEAFVRSNIDFSVADRICIEGNIEWIWSENTC